jgi:hypothetical protein
MEDLENRTLAVGAVQRFTMLNDVHFPPPNSKAPVGKPVGGHAHLGREDRSTSSVRDRLPTVDRADFPEAIYGEPEDRGDSFNTSLSTSVVVIVVLVVVGLAWAVFL